LVLTAGPGGATVVAGDSISSSLPCGAIVLPGYDWLGGNGVDVFSNGADAGEGNSCGGTSKVNGVISGEEWQCVELVDRLYLTQGWIKATWFGNGADMYALAPSNLAKQPQGSISFLSPGDVISYQSPGGVEPGHAGIVNSVTPISLGRYEIQLVQQNGYLYTAGVLSNGVLTMTTGWVKNFPVIGVIHHPGATAPAERPANLLENASFERNAAAGWSLGNPKGGKVAALALKGSRLPEGSNLLKFGTSKPGGSVYQDVTVDLEPGQSYTFSVWARSNATTKESVCVVLWGLGRVRQRGQTCTKVGPAWTHLSAPYDVRATGLWKLRAQVYLYTAGPRLDVTGTSLVDDSLASASFENDVTAGWSLLDPTGGHVRGLAHKATGLPEGSNLLEMSTSKPGGSLFQDVPVHLVPNQSYTFSIWARASAKSNESICVVLWGLGSGAERGETCATIGKAWKLVSVPYDVSAYGLYRLRAQVYLFTKGLLLDLTGASLTDDVLENGSFEHNQTAGWRTTSPPGGKTDAVAIKATGLPEGSNLLKFGTSKPGGSVYQDVGMDLERGQSYTFSVWARSNSTAKVSVCVILWGRGNGSQGGQTCVKVSDAWTLVSAPYDVSVAGLTSLRAQVDLLTAGPRLDLTGASLGGSD
jgi:uncharacterized protein YciI